MITFAFFLVFSMMIILIGFIDILFFHKSLNEFLIEALSLQFGTRKWWVLSGVFMGIFYSLIADYKRYKAKKEVSEGT